MTPTERRDLILLVLTMQREHHEQYGTWLKVADIEAQLKNERAL